MKGRDPYWYAQPLLSPTPLPSLAFPPMEGPSEAAPPIKPRDCCCCRARKSTAAAAPAASGAPASSLVAWLPLPRGSIAVTTTAVAAASAKPLSRPLRCATIMSLNSLKSVRATRMSMTSPTISSAVRHVSAVYIYHITAASNERTNERQKQKQHKRTFRVRGWRVSTIFFLILKPSWDFREREREKKK